MNNNAKSGRHSVLSAAPCLSAAPYLSARVCLSAFLSATVCLSACAGTEIDRSSTTDGSQANAVADSPTSSPVESLANATGSGASHTENERAAEPGRELAFEDFTSEAPQPEFEWVNGEKEFTETHVPNYPRPSSSGKSVSLPGASDKDSGLTICHISGQETDDGEDRYFARHVKLSKEGPATTGLLCNQFEAFGNSAREMPVSERDGRPYDRGDCETFTNLELNRFGNVCEHIAVCAAVNDAGCAGYSRSELQDIVEAEVPQDRVHITLDGQLSVGRIGVLAQGEPVDLQRLAEGEVPLQFLRWQSETGSYVFRAMTDDADWRQGGLCLDAGGRGDRQQMNLWTCDTANANQLQLAVAEGTETIDSASGVPRSYVAVDGAGSTLPFRTRDVVPNH